MTIDPYMSDAAVLREIGRRVAQTRLERNLLQLDLAKRAGVGLATLKRLERGQSVSSTSLIRVLRALDLLTALENAVPEPLPSPVEQLKLRGRRRKRAGRPRRGDASTAPEPWRWGDEGNSEHG
jgi:transcriptional regulator with XRE-family HTH domain